MVVVDRGGMDFEITVADCVGVAGFIAGAGLRVHSLTGRIYVRPARSASVDVIVPLTFPYRGYYLPGSLAYLALYVAT